MVRSVENLLKTGILYYAGSGEWRPLPGWARFFIELGMAFGPGTRTGIRTIAGVALPTRHYGAALAAAGIVAARAALPARSLDPHEHFRWLASLPAGTSVLVRDGDKELKGVFTGCEVTSYGPRAMVQVEKRIKGAGGGMTRGFPPETATNIRQSDKVVSADKLPKKQGGRTRLSEREIADQNLFAEHFLPEVNIYEFVTSSRLECVMVGHTGLLRQEIKETIFAASSPQSATLAHGTLQDVLRVSKFSGARDSYRSSVIYTNSTTLPALPGSTAPAVAVFDGAASFVKWRDAFRHSSWIVLISRTERLASDAADLLNTEYLQYRIEGNFLPEMPTIPAGVELTIFQEEAE